MVEGFLLICAAVMLYYGFTTTRDIIKISKESDEEHK